MAIKQAGKYAIVMDLNKEFQDNIDEKKERRWTSKTDGRLVQ